MQNRGQYKGEYVVAVLKPTLVQVYLVHEAFGEEELEEILSSVRDNKELVKSSTFWSINQINDPSFVTKNYITFVQVISPKNFSSIFIPQNDLRFGAQLFVHFSAQKIIYMVSVIRRV